MNNYDQLIKALDTLPALQILKHHYSNIIDIYIHSNQTISTQQMITILQAAEQDSLKLNLEIENLNSYIYTLRFKKYQIFLDLQINYYQQNLKSKLKKIMMDSLLFTIIIGRTISLKRYPDDEYQEILCEIEQQLISNVQKLSENQLINFSIQKYDNLDYQTAMDIITKFVESRCINKEVEKILNQQLQNQMIKYQKKNYILQIENMKILSNTNSMNFYQQQKCLQSFSFDKLQLNYLNFDIIIIINNKTKVLSYFKITQKFKKRNIINKRQILNIILQIRCQLANNSMLFIIKYSLNQITKENTLIFLVKFNKIYYTVSYIIYIIASQQIDNNDISIVFDKLQQKLINQIAQTACQVTANFEEIVTSRSINNSYLEQILNQTKGNFNKILKYNKMISSIQQEKETLQGQIRYSMECLIKKLNDENMKLKLVQLTNVLEKSFKKQSQSSLESLKSIQYK